MNTIAIFCGSSSVAKPIYLQSTRDLGIELAKKNINIICGGGSTGLMKSLIDGALEFGGNVTGVILNSENSFEAPHHELTSLVYVENLAERKEWMISRSDAFITLPGSLGTLDEFFNVLGSRRAGLHHKPCVIFNINGFYDDLSNLFEHMLNEGFIKIKHKNLLLIESDISKIEKHLGIGNDAKRNLLAY